MIIFQPLASGTLTKIVDDTFVEGSDTAIASHVPTVLGTSWVQEILNGSIVLTVVAATDTLTCTTAANSSGWLGTTRPNPSVAEYDVIVNVPGWTASGDDPGWMVARYTDTSNYYLAGFYPTAGTTDLKIIKNVAGTKTVLASSNSDLSPVATWKFEVRNATKKLYRNGVEVLTTSDNALTSAGSAGLSMGNTGDVATDDTSTNNDFDNYQVWEFTA